MAVGQALVLVATPHEYGIPLFFHEYRNIL
jgi:hypothetical protein